MSRRLPLGLALLVGFLLGAPSSAHAEEGELSRFTWRPSLTLRAIADDNVYQRDRGVEDDFALWASPRLELNYQASAYELGADVGVDFRQYAEESDLNETFYRVNAHGEAGLWPGLSLRIADSYVPQPETLGLPDDDASNLQQTNRVSGELRYQRALDGRRELTLGVGGARFDTESFDAALPGPNGSTVFDTSFRASYTEGGGFLELRNAVGKRSSVYLRGRARYRTFDDAPESDHTGVSARLGFRTHLLRRLELEVSGGWGLIAYDSQSDDQRFLGAADLRYRAGSGWTFHLGAHNKFTSDLRGNQFADTTGRLGVEKFFGRRTSASITGFASYLENDSLQRSANFYAGAEVGIKRQLSTRLQVGLSYRYWNNQGNYEADDFEQNRLMFNLSYRH